MWAGAEQACYRLARLLSKENKIELDILATKPIKKPKEYFFNFYSIPTSSNYFGKIGQKFVEASQLDYISYFYSRSYFKKNRPDLVHLHNFDRLSLSLIQSAKRSGIPIVFSVYDFWCMCPNRMLIDSAAVPCRRFHGSRCVKCIEPKFPSLFYKFLFSARKPIFDYFLDKIDVFIVLTNSGAKILQQYGIDKKKIRVIPLPLLHEIDVREKIEKEKNSILYVGWISKHKGLDIVIKALPQIVKDAPNAKLYVIGSERSEKDTSEILDLATRLRVREKVILLGRKPFEEVKKYVIKTEVVVVPEQWEITLSTFLTEAMLFEKPIVASRIGGIPEFVSDGETGYLADPKNPLDFADKIVLLFREKKLAETIGKNARKKILQKCSEASILTSLCQLYESLVQKQ